MIPTSWKFEIGHRVANKLRISKRGRVVGYADAGYYEILWDGDASVDMRVPEKFVIAEKLVK